MNLPGLAGAIRFISLTGATLAIGATMTRGWLPASCSADARLRRTSVAGGLLVLLGGFLELGRIILSLSGGDPTMALSLLPALAKSSTGQIVSLRLLIALLLGTRQAWKIPMKAPEATFWGLLLAGCLAWDGHAIDLTGSREVVALIADTGHILLAASWLGGLLMVTWLNRKVPDAGKFIRQFSRMAGIAMPGAVLTGFANVFLHLPSSGLLELATFTWGRLLLIKMAMVLAILWMALGLRYRTHQVGAECLPQDIRKKLRAEAALGLIVLAVTGWLSQSSPSPHVNQDSMIQGRRSLLLWYLPRL